MCSLELSVSILLKETPSPLRVLQNMIEHHDGVRLIARFTVLGAKTICELLSVIETENINN